MGLTACQTDSHEAITFEQFEIEADGATEDGVPAAMSIKFDIPTEENGTQEKITENYKQLIRQTEVGKALNLPLDGSLQDIAKAYTDYFPRGVKEEELRPAMYLLWIESGFQTEKSVNFKVSSGIFSNGGPYEDIVVMNRNDGKFLHTEELLSIPHADLERLAQEYTTDPDINLNDLIEGYYQIVPDSAGCLLHYLIGSHLFGEIRMPVSAVEPYLTEAGKEVFRLEQPGWWGLTTRGISPWIRYLLYGLCGVLALILLVAWSIYDDGKQLKKKVAEVNAELDRLQHAADRGDAQACAELAQRYINGFLVQTDLKKAIKLAHKALDLGNSDAKRILGIAYFEQGKNYMASGMDSDVRNGAESYRKSTQYDYAPAFNKLGVCYLKGKGLEQNIRLGFELVKTSYEKGCIDACAAMASYYYEPQYGNVDPVMEHKWNLTGAKGGCTICQLRLGYAYDLGNKTVAKDVREARKWFKLVADNIDAPKRERGAACWWYAKTSFDLEQIEEGKRYVRKAIDLGYDTALKYGYKYLRL